MRASSFLLLLLLLVLKLVLFSSSLSFSTIKSDLIDQICKKTPFYELCKSALVGSESGTDAKALARSMANVLLANATDTLNFIHSQESQAPDPKMERALAYCAELYIPVVKYNLPQAIDALTRGRFGFAADALSDAAKQADACEKNFSGNLKSPLTQRNNLVHSLSDVAVAIVKLLPKPLL